MNQSLNIAPYPIETTDKDGIFSARSCKKVSSWPRRRTSRVEFPPELLAVSVYCDTVAGWRGKRISRDFCTAMSSEISARKPERGAGACGGDPAANTFVNKGERAKYSTRADWKESGSVKQT